MMMRAGAILAAGNILSALLNFLRNILIARLISVEDYGIAATFIITASVIGMLSNLSLDRLIVQAPDGDDPKLISAVQGFTLARGFMNSALLFALAWPMAALFGHPDLVWAYQFVALPPLLNAFNHLDMARYQRRMNFTPTAVNNAAASLISLLAVWPMALWLGDFRVMLFQIVLNAALMVAGSHLMAERPFRIGWDMTVIRRAFAFGWPLLISGGLTFLIMQGDRIVVGNQFGAYELGLFSAAVTFAIAPSTILDGILRQFFMPLLSRLQDRREAFEMAAVAVMQALLCAGVGLAALFALFAAPVFSMVYGERYVPAVPAMLMLAALFSLRLMRAGPTTVSISRAATRSPMYANIVRLISFPLAFLAAAQGASVTMVVAISALGELASMALAVFLVQSRLGILRLDLMGWPYLLSLAALLILASLSEFPPVGLFDWRHAVMVALGITLLVLCREMRGRVFDEIRRARKRG